jgi:drug/metabolite transporter (DMT)-like permease
MTTTHAGIRSRLGRPLPADARAALDVGAAAGAFLLVLSPVWLALVNLYGPFQEARAPGALLALVGATVAGAAALLTVDRIARRSGAAALALLVAGVAAGAVLLPQPIDQHESFLPRVNERFSCTGWSFEYYPPGVMDGTGTTYCVGVESRLPDG